MLSDDQTQIDQSPPMLSDDQTQIDQSLPMLSDDQTLSVTAYVK
jgi:hypothetical protein